LYPHCLTDDVRLHSVKNFTVHTVHLIYAYSCMYV